MICWRGILGRMCLIFEVVGREEGRDGGEVEWDLEGWSG